MSKKELNETVEKIAEQYGLDNRIIPVYEEDNSVPKDAHEMALLLVSMNK